VLDLRPFQERAAGVVADAVLRPFSPLAYLQDGLAPALPMLIARAGQDRPALNGAAPGCAAPAIWVSSDHGADESE
jgi:hypothetical protein